MFLFSFATSRAFFSASSCPFFSLGRAQLFSPLFLLFASGRVGNHERSESAAFTSSSVCCGDASCSKRRVLHVVRRRSCPTVFVFLPQPGGSLPPFPCPLLFVLSLPLFHEDHATGCTETAERHVADALSRNVWEKVQKNLVGGSSQESGVESKDENLLHHPSASCRRLLLCSCTSRLAASLMAAGWERRQRS